MEIYFVTPEGVVIDGWHVYVVLAFPPKRPNRKQRGAIL